VFDWIIRNWRDQWLGNFAWWQAFAGVVQAVVAFFLFRVTCYLAKVGVFQSRLQTQSLKISLFQKRLDTFLSVMGFLANGRAEPPTAIQLRRDTITAEFLFDPEIEAFIDKVYTHAIKVNSLETKINSEGDPDRRETLFREFNPLMEWLSVTAFTEAKALFGRYLVVSDLEEPPTIATSARSKIGRT